MPGRHATSSRARLPLRLAVRLQPFGLPLVLLAHIPGRGAQHVLGPRLERGMSNGRLARAVVLFWMISSTRADLRRTLHRLTVAWLMAPLLKGNT